MPANRSVKQVFAAKPVTEGAGVKLHRAFGYHEKPLFDRFLLLDDFGSDNPDDFLAGFPWHPHRGIETITYLIEGAVEHGDSLGNKGVINTGDVQWMTAGNGIIHQEMPKSENGQGMQGLQLWANLPAQQKMTEPKYRDIRQKQIPIIHENGVEIHVIAGNVNETQGPVQDIAIDPELLDVILAPGSSFDYAISQEHAVYAYVMQGKVIVDNGAKTVTAKHVMIFGDGDHVHMKSESGCRLLLFSGIPLNEPVAWAGPIVMNTSAELSQAFKEYREGSFLQYNSSPPAASE